MPDKQTDEAVTEAFALVGGISTGFASLEFHLQFILVLFISGKEDSSEAFLTIRDRQFSQKIQLLKDFVVLKFPKGDDLRTEGLALVKTLDSLRMKRNLFIHGYWLINEGVLATTGGIRCSDTRWKFDKKTEEWASLETHDFSLTELHKQIRENKAAFDALYQYNQNVLGVIAPQ